MEEKKEKKEQENLNPTVSCLHAFQYENQEKTHQHEIDPQIQAQLPDYIQTLIKLIAKAKQIKALELSSKNSNTSEKE